MAFVICHLQKFTKGSVIGIQKHNQREQKNYSNANIERDKTKFNYDLHNNHNIKYLDIVDKIIQENRTNTTRAVRKDAIVMCNTLISASPEFFENITEHERDRYFRTCYTFLSNYFGKDNVISANVHLDETTPHMHFSFVPLTDGALSAKKVMSRPNLRKIQTDLAKYLQDHGFNIERGKEGAQKKYDDLNILKNKTEKETLNQVQKLKELEVSFDEIKEYFSKFKERYEMSKETDRFILDVANSAEQEKLLFMNTDRIKIKKEDFDKLLNLAASSHFTFAKNLELQEDLKESNKTIEYLKSNFNYRNEFYKKDRELFEKDRELSKTKKTLNFASKIYDFNIHELEEKIEKSKESFNAQFEKSNVKIQSKSINKSKSKVKDFDDELEL